MFGRFSCRNMIPKFNKVLFRNSSYFNPNDPPGQSVCNSNILVDLKEAKRFVYQCFRAVKLSKLDSQSLADLIVAADYRGVYHEGILRIERLVEQIYLESIDVRARPEIKNESPAMALVDGKNGLGVVIGNFCMDLAVAKAKDQGIGWVSVQNSNDICMATWYLLRAMHNNMLGIVMSNSPPTMVPTNGLEPLLGNSCFAFAAKGERNHIVFDMSTCAKEPDHLLNPKGQEDDDANAPGKPSYDEKDDQILERSEDGRHLALQPVGGSKGYFFGAMIDVLCGVLPHANYLSRVPLPHRASPTNFANLGQVFIAIDPLFFAHDFGRRLDDFRCRLKTSSSDGEREVLTPGELESRHMADVESNGGIFCPALCFKRCQYLAEFLNVQPLSIASAWKCIAKQRRYS